MAHLRNLPAMAVLFYLAEANQLLALSRLGGRYFFFIITAVQSQNAVGLLVIESFMLKKHLVLRCSIQVSACRYIQLSTKRF